MMTIIDSQYFPSIPYLSYIKASDEIWIDAKENFVKQTYRNRCYILGPNKVQPLSVPVKNGNRKIPMDEILIDYKHDWIKDHWRSITTAYNKSPFFEYYEPYIHDILHRKPERLLELNQDIMSFCLKVLNIDTKVNLTNKYESGEKGQIEDMRSKIHPKKDYICSKIKDPIPYPQLFGQEFAAKLSVLDLLSNTGPESDNYL
ncbi:WbqC family protein [Reichenbachiella ulvae]|uniref:WbqC family protein n=1 Tax=Reichenbachiella ulvae TaxID=2980104 RepID=A0ABT3CV77_9BACT|nr:WbqC family protein [Reichenbachiella ulvae]MCV9387524.1 WbqC family protein [Reichenbachiella ulvae]